MDFLDCKICQVPYDEEEHRPRHAPCGHELCSACIRALIMEGIFECPKCRQKNKVNVPEDLPLNFGLIDVIRAFKTNTVSFKESEVSVSGATITEVCKAHHKSITHRCLKCNIWTCVDCLKSHSDVIGCSIINSTKAMDNMKKEHIETVDKQLTSYDENVTQVSIKIQEQSDEKENLMEKLEKCDEEIKKLQNSLEEGNALREDLVVYKNDLNSADSPFAVSDRIEVLTQREQSLRIWSLNSLERPEVKEPNHRQDLLKALGKKKNVFVEMIFTNEKRHAKLSKHYGNILFPSFKSQQDTSDSNCMPFDHLQKMIPKEASLVFVELSLGGTVKGKVFFQLDKNLPNFRERMVTIVTGQRGKSLAGIKLNRTSDFLYNEDLPFKEITFNPDRSGIYNGKIGDVVANNGRGLLYAYFLVANYAFSSGFIVIGSITAGMDILKECHTNHSRGVAITDSGFVLECE